MTKYPLVSVLCLAYNQEGYIKQCLDGILSQKTNFSYEVLINDDASTDGTRDIIELYKNKYPSLIKTIFHKENQYQKGKRNFLVRYLLPKVKGRYIAVCEGDDYWTDTTKLQRQVDFLESNPDYSLVFHPVIVRFEDGSVQDTQFPENKDELTVERLVGENFIQTNSVMYRVLSSYKGYKVDVGPGDWYLHLFHAQFGKIGFIDKTMSVYRRHQGGIWWGSIGDEAEFLKKVFSQHINLFSASRSMFSSDQQVLAKIDDVEENFVKKAVSLNTDSIEFMQEISRLTPNVAGKIITEMHSQKVLAQSKELEAWNALMIAQGEAQRLINSKTYRAGKFIVIPVQTAKKMFNLRQDLFKQ